MFNLEKSIAGWRQQMLAAGIKRPVPLEELEAHLREEFGRQMQAGLIERQAFDAAVHRIGRPEALENEFKKVERRHMKRILIVTMGVISILVGMAFVMPAVAQYRHEGAMTLNEICLFLLGVGLTLGGGSMAVFNCRRRKA